MHGGGNPIYRLHVIIHNGLFAKCEVLDNFRGLVVRGQLDKNLQLGPRGQGLTSRTTTLRYTVYVYGYVAK